MSDHIQVALYTYIYKRYIGGESVSLVHYFQKQEQELSTRDGINC
jgi:hypothetical protein